MEKRRLTLYFLDRFRYIRDMIKKILDYVQKYQMIESGDTIVAGISGGADSVCLLFVMLELQKKLSFSIEVVHINHGIRKEAGEDADFVKQLCNEKKLPFHLVEENIRQRAEHSGLSEEEEGRKVRYQAFETVLGKRKGHIAVAHNSNDRAETMLFHLFRGTGLAGASGIKPVNGRIIRPLLCVQRKEIEEWLAVRNISFCTDATNAQDVYTRNRIRHHILPYVEQEICAGAIANMNRAGDQLLEAEEYAARQGESAMKRCVSKEEHPACLTVDIPKFLSEDSYLQGRILHACIEQMAGCKKDITAEHIANVKELFEKSGSKEIHLPYGLIVYKKYDLGIIQKNLFHDEAECDMPEYEITVPSALDIPELGRVEITLFPYKKTENIPEKTYTKWFDYDKITSSVVLRTKKAGDYLTVNSQMGRKSLQDYLVNEKVPKSERSRIYLLTENSHVLWIPGYRISEYYKVGSKTRNILQISISKEEGSHYDD